MIRSPYRVAAALSAAVCFASFAAVAPPAAFAEEPEPAALEAEVAGDLADTELGADEAAAADVAAEAAEPAAAAETAEAMAEADAAASPGEGQGDPSLAAAGEPAAAAVPPVPVAAPFAVSTCTTCVEQAVRLAGAGSGAFLAVWPSTTAADPVGISGRLYSTAGAPLGGDRGLAKQPTVPESDGNVAATTQGKFVVVWSAPTGTPQLDIKGQLFKSNGTAASAVFTVNVDEPTLPSRPNDFNPVVAATRDGGFVVAWARIIPATVGYHGSSPQIWLRRYRANGTPAAAPVQVNTTLASSSRPDVCVDSTDQAIVTWTPIDRYEPYVQSLNGVAARRFSPASAPVGGEIVVKAPATIMESRPSIACLTGGAWVVAWQTDQPPSVDRFDVVAQRWSKVAAPAGPVFLVGSRTAGRQQNPAVAADAAGKRYVVTWDVTDSTTFPNHIGISGRAFAAGGAPQGGDFTVYDEVRDATQPSRPDVAYVGTAGHFVVVWQDAAKMIMGRRFKPGP